MALVAHISAKYTRIFCSILQVLFKAQRCLSGSVSQTYIPGDNSNTDNSCDSDFKYIENSCNETDENFSDSSTDNDETEM